MLRSWWQEVMCHFYSWTWWQYLFSYRNCILTNDRLKIATAWLRPPPSLLGDDTAGGNNNRPGVSPSAQSGSKFWRRAGSEQTRVLTGSSTASRGTGLNTNTNSEPKKKLKDRKARRTRFDSALFASSSGYRRKKNKQTWSCFQSIVSILVIGAEFERLIRCKLKKKPDNSWLTTGCATETTKRTKTSSADTPLQFSQYQPCWLQSEFILHLKKKQFFFSTLEQLLLHSLTESSRSTRSWISTESTGSTGFLLSGCKR